MGLTPRRPFTQMETAAKKATNSCHRRDGQRQETKIEQAEAQIGRRVGTQGENREKPRHAAARMGSDNGDERQHQRKLREFSGPDRRRDTGSSKVRRRIALSFTRMFGRFAVKSLESKQIW